MVADEVGSHPVAAARVGPVLQLRRDDGLEAPLEGDRLGGVRFQGEDDAAQGSVHLVTDGSDDGRFGIGGEAPAGPDRHLLDTARDPGVAVHDIAVGVLPQAEAELEASVLGRGHGADLLGPRGITGGHHGEGVGDLMGEALVPGEKGPDGIGHMLLQ